MVDRPQNTPMSRATLTEDGRALLTCGRCGLKYQPNKSTSALRLTYCSFLCELGDLGFSITGLENMQRTEPSEDDGSDDESGEPESSDRPELAPVE